MNNKQSLGLYLKKPETWVNLVTLLVAIFLGIRSVKSGKINEYLQSVLTVLGLLALSQFFVSYSSITRDKRINEVLDSFTSLAQGKLPARLFLTTRKDLSPLEVRLPSVLRTLDVMGLSLLSICSTHQGLIRDLANSGIKIRLIVTDPDNQAVQETIAKRIYEVDSAEQHSRLVTTALENIGAVASGLEESDVIEVRMLEAIPPFSYLGIDTGLSRGIISVEFYLTKIPLSKNPVLVLDPSTDHHWYSEFKEQFEVIWQISKRDDMNQTGT